MKRFSASAGNKAAQRGGGGALLGLRVEGFGRLIRDSDLGASFI